MVCSQKRPCNFLIILWIHGFDNGFHIFVIKIYKIRYGWSEGDRETQKGVPGWKQVPFMRLAEWIDPVFTQVPLSLSPPLQQYQILFLTHLIYLKFVNFLVFLAFIGSGRLCSFHFLYQISLVSWESLYFDQQNAESYQICPVQKVSKNAESYQICSVQQDERAESWLAPLTCLSSGSWTYRHLSPAWDIHYIVWHYFAM